MNNINLVIEGWLLQEEGLLLYNLAKKCTGKGVIVEIGSWKGKSTIYLAQGSKMGNKIDVYAIDPHTYCKHQSSFPKFQENIRKAKVDNIVIPLVMISKEAIRDFRQPVELIFIDGNHRYEFVKLDFDLWFPKLVEGGVMAFHDTIGESGPRKVVRQFLFNSRQFRNIGLMGRITFGKKVRSNSTVDVLRNQCFLFLHYIIQIMEQIRVRPLFFSIWQRWMKIKQRKIERSFKTSLKVSSERG